MTPVRAGTRPGIEPPTRHSSYDHADEWRERAACLDADPEAFFPPGTGPESVAMYNDARRICLGCPVRVQCLVDGKGEPYGMWGGTTPEERGFKVGSSVTSRRRRRK